MPKDVFGRLKKKISSDAISGFIVFTCLAFESALLKHLDFPTLMGVLTAIIGD